MIIDTHAHYDDEAFNEDRHDLLMSLKDNNVELVINASASISECKATLELMEKYPFVYGMIGVHPEEVSKLTEDDLKWLEKISVENAIYNGGKVVAIGEIGLDYHYDEPSKDIQTKWFIKQLELARKVKLPLNIHSRDAAKDTMDILKDAKADEIGGVIHCYSYSLESAKEYLNLGFKFGIGGVLTFKNARKLVEVVEYLPMDAIVLETDAPYLAPMPNRGTRNDSTNIKFVAAKIAEIKGISEEEVIDITSVNARKVYNICQL